MLEECRVKKVKGKTAYIAVVKGAKCQGCKACVFGDKKEIILPAVNDIGCKPGDAVLAEIPEREILAAPLILYLFPLVLIAAGLLIGGFFGTVVQIILVFALLALSFVVIYFIDRGYRKRAGYAPRIIEIIKQGDKND